MFMNFNHILIEIQYKWYLTREINRFWISCACDAEIQWTIMFKWTTFVSAGQQFIINSVINMPYATQWAPARIPRSNELDISNRRSNGSVSWELFPAWSESITERGNGPTMYKCTRASDRYVYVSATFIYRLRYSDCIVLLELMSWLGNR